MFKVGQRVIVDQPPIVSAVAVAPRVSVSGTITGRQGPDYIVKLNAAPGELDIAVVSENRLRPIEEHAG